jgi:hypothetical protein
MTDTNTRRSLALIRGTFQCLHWLLMCGVWNCRHSQVTLYALTRATPPLPCARESRMRKPSVSTRARTHARTHTHTHTHTHTSHLIRTPLHHCSWPCCRKHHSVMRRLRQYRHNRSGGGDPVSGAGSVWRGVHLQRAKQHGADFGRDVQLAPRLRIKRHVVS